MCTAASADSAPRREHGMSLVADEPGALKLAAPSRVLVETGMEQAVAEMSLSPSGWEEGRKFDPRKADLLVSPNIFYPDRSVRDVKALFAHTDPGLRFALPDGQILTHRGIAASVLLPRDLDELADLESAARGTGGTEAALALEALQAGRALADAFSSSPFGHGTETGQDPEVRDCKEVGPEMLQVVEEDQRTMDLLAAFAVRAMGFSSDNVSARLHKVLAYEKGGHFVRHRDSVHRDGAIATITVRLPATQVYASPGLDSVTAKPNAVGGDLEVLEIMRDGAEVWLKPSWGTTEPCITAFRLEQEHRVAPVTGGGLVAATFDIVAQHDTVPTPGAGGTAGEAEILRELLGGSRYPLGERPADFTANAAQISDNNVYVDFWEFAPDADLITHAGWDSQVPELVAAGGHKFDIPATIYAVESPQVQAHPQHSALEVVGGPAVGIAKAARSILADKVEESDVLILLQDVYFHHHLDPTNALRGEFSLRGLDAKICEVANSLEGVRWVLAPIRGKVTSYPEDSGSGDADFRVCLSDEVAATFATTKPLALLDLPRKRAMSLVGTVPEDLDFYGNNGARVDCTLVGYALALWKEEEEEKAE